MHLGAVEAALRAAAAHGDEEMGANVCQALRALMGSSDTAGVLNRVMRGGGLQALQAIARVHAGAPPPARPAAGGGRAPWVGAGRGRRRDGNRRARSRPGCVAAQSCLHEPGHHA